MPSDSKQEELLKARLAGLQRKVHIAEQEKADAKADVKRCVSAIYLALPGWPLTPAHLCLQ